MATLTQTTRTVPFAQKNPTVQLNNQDQSEVLAFLAARPKQTFIETSWIRDNGLVSSFNRGSFYGYRDAQSNLKGVALIGHVTLFQTDSDSALAAFARLTKACPTARVVLGEQEKISRFTQHYQSGGGSVHKICRELLLDKNQEQSLNTVSALRRARPEELDLVVPAHAQTAFEQSGVNPLEVDRTGFIERCARRVNQGRTWVAIEKGILEFKAEIVSETPEVVYVEGVYVGARHRGNGYGAKCMTQLTNHLLEGTKSVCLFVNEENSAALTCYRKAAYEFRASYDTVYLKPQEQPLS